MELVVKEYEKHGEIEMVEVFNNTNGEVYTMSYKNDVYDLISSLGYGGEQLTISFEFYSFDWLITNEYKRIK